MLPEVPVLALGEPVGGAGVPAAAVVEPGRPDSLGDIVPVVPDDIDPLPEDMVPDVPEVPVEPLLMLPEGAIAPSAGAIAPSAGAMAEPVVPVSAVGAMAASLVAAVSSERPHAAMLRAMTQTAPAVTILIFTAVSSQFLVT